MITVNQAKELIAAAIQPLAPVRINLDEAAGHILAADIFAAVDIPGFRQSSMDGYAFRFDAGLSSYNLTGEMAAGTTEVLEIKAGEATRIFTGAPLPGGADTVVMQEKITKENNNIIVNDPMLSVGSNVREKGSEIKADALAMAKGSLLSPAAIGFLAGIGTTKVAVYPMPKVAVILTGNELQQPGKALAFGQVYEANSFALSAALKNEGIDDIKLFWVNDDLDLLMQSVNEALENSDVVLLTGGVSVGDYDFVTRAAGACGIEQIFHKVKQRPGKPLFFGTKNKQLVFGLPGNPSSVLSCFYNYALPALKGLSCKQDSVTTIQAELSTDYKKTAGLTHFLKGIYADGKASPLNAQESFRLSSFAHANCLICLDETEEFYKAGTTVTIMLLPQ